MPSFIYPIAAEISEITADYLGLAQDQMVGQKMFPVVPKSTFKVRWSIDDNAYGLMQYRGLDGRPPKVTRIGAQVLEYDPAVYGEFQPISEAEYLNRASASRPTERIPIGDLVKKAEELNIQRDIARREYNIWTLLATGTLNINMNGPAGATVAQDVFPIQTYTASPTWNVTATATPLLDLHNVQQKWIGHSVNFGAGAKLYMNQVTANNFMFNTNSADLYGYRDQYGATVGNNLQVINNFLTGRNLPSIEVVDYGYQTIYISGVNTSPTTANFQKFIPNHVAILVGQRPGNAPIGEFQMCPNADNNSVAGVYSYVADYFNGVNAPMMKPGRLEVHRGFNGGLALQYPSAIVAMAV